MAAKSKSPSKTPFRRRMVGDYFTLSFTVGLRTAQALSKNSEGSSLISEGRGYQKEDCHEIPCTSFGRTTDCAVCSDSAFTPQALGDGETLYSCGSGRHAR